MDRLVIIDGHAILHRAFHALPPLLTKKGEEVNAVFGFTSMLLRVIADLKPTHLIVTFDRPTPTFRKALYVGYQSKRPKMDEGLVSQIENVHKVVEVMGIPIFEMDGYEADDVIGTLAFQASGLKIKNQKSKLEKEIEVIIVTGDRDILQLVDEMTKVYMPIKGISQSKLFGEREVEEKFGITSSQIIDYKALVGDASDNYPGVSGVGPKTASLLLTRYKTLEEIYIHIGEIESERLRKTLAENSESAAMAKKLATIVKDVPITINLEKSKLKNIDRPHVHQLFEELEFRSLITRLSGVRNSSTTLRTSQESGIKNKESFGSVGGKQKKENTDQQIKLF